MTQPQLDKVPEPERMKRSGHAFLEMYNSFYPKLDNPDYNLIDAG